MRSSVKRRKARGKKRAVVKLLLVSSCRVRPRPRAVRFPSRLRLPLSSLLENRGRKALSSVNSVCLLARTAEDMLMI